MRASKLVASNSELVMSTLGLSSQSSAFEVFPGGREVSSKKDLNKQIVQDQVRRAGALGYRHTCLNPALLAGAKISSQGYLGGHFHSARSCNDMFAASFGVFTNLLFLCHCLCQKD